MRETKCYQVVGLTLFDLRRLGKVDKLGMVGVDGSKFPAIRRHLQENIANVYKDMDTTYANHIFCARLVHFLSASMPSRTRLKLTQRLVRCPLYDGRQNHN